MFHILFVTFLDAFLKGIGLSLLTSSQFILHHFGAEFYKPTVPQYPPSHSQDYSTSISPELIFCLTLPKLLTML